MDYDLTLIKALVFDIDGVLSMATIPMDNEGKPLRTINIKDGYAIQLAVKAGLHVAILTGGRSEMIARRYAALGVTHICMGSDVKIRDFTQLLQTLHVTPQETLYMGDDIPDYEVLKATGLPTCPHDAAPEIKTICRYVSPYDGGMGAGRDVIEQVLRAQGKWMADKQAFGW